MATPQDTEFTKYAGQLIKSGTMEDVKGDESLESVFLELEDDNA